MKQELQSIRFNTYNTTLQLAKKHRAEGLCRMAEDLYKQTIGIARTLNEREPFFLCAALFELANYFDFQTKYNQAESLWSELKTYQKYFGSNHCIYVQTIFSLAQINEFNGNTDTTEVLYKELLARQEEELGDESLDICPAMSQLAAFYYRQEKYSLAENLYLRILVIKEFYFGTCSPEINYTVDALIEVFKKLYKWRLAEYMMSRQKSILLALHGKDSLCVATCALRLAELQIHTKQPNRAIENLSFAVQVYKNTFGELANPVISLQNRLNTLLISGMEMNFMSIEDVIDSDDKAITINLESSENTALKIPSLVTA